MPTFGNTTIEASNLTGEGIINGGVFTMGATAGEADSVTVYLVGSLLSSGTFRVRCAIYLAGADPALVANGTTEERTLDNGVDGTGWFTFNYTGTKPSLSASTNYVLCCWIETTAGGTWRGRVKTTTGQGLETQTIAYTGTFPDPLVNSPVANYLVSIYCTYTEVTGAVIPVGMDGGMIDYKGGMRG